MPSICERHKMSQSRIRGPVPRRRGLQWTAQGRAGGGGERAATADCTIARPLPSRASPLTTWSSTSTRRATPGSSAVWQPCSSRFCLSRRCCSRLCALRGSHIAMPPTTNALRCAACCGSRSHVAASRDVAKLHAACVSRTEARTVRRKIENRSHTLLLLLHLTIHTRTAVQAAAKKLICERVNVIDSHDSPVATGWPDVGCAPSRKVLKSGGTRKKAAANTEDATAPRANVSKRAPKGNTALKDMRRTTPAPIARRAGRRPQLVPSGLGGGRGQQHDDGRFPAFGLVERRGAAGDGEACTKRCETQNTGISQPPRESRREAITESAHRRPALKDARLDRLCDRDPPAYPWCTPSMAKMFLSLFFFFKKMTNFNLVNPHLFKKKTSKHTQKRLIRGFKHTPPTAVRFQSKKSPLREKG